MLIEHNHRCGKIAIFVSYMASMFFPGYGMCQQPSSTDFSHTADRLSSREAALRQQLETLRANNAAEADANVMQVQSDLLEVTGEKEAALQQLPENAKGPTTSYISVPVFFATDRMRNGDAFEDILSRDGLDFGLATVTLALPYAARSDAIAGARNLPQSTHVALPTIQRMSSVDALLSAIKTSRLDQKGTKRKVVLFVHGYNVSFSDAVNAAARLSTVLQFPAIPVAYSWPSSGTLRGYWHDEDTVRASSQEFTTFLKDFLSKSSTDVILICHSMGAREVTSALSEIGRAGTQLPALKKVIFAAADISQEEFLIAWPSLQKLKGVDYSFYASDHDLALRLSHIVHRLPRLGDASPKVTGPKGGITIDASAVDSIFQNFGHSYILDSLKIGADIGEWVDGGRSPQARGLVRIGAGENIYYVFP